MNINNQIPAETIATIKTLMTLKVMPAQAIASIFDVSQIYVYKLAANERRADIELTSIKNAKRELYKVLDARFEKDQG